MNDVVSRLMFYFFVVVSTAVGALATHADTEFTAPAPLNANAATDSKDDYARAIVASDGAGHWVAVWESKDTLGDTIGKDVDILVARSTGDGQNWSAPIALNSNAATDSGQDRTPVVATDGHGHWVTVWWSDDTLGGTIKKDWDIFVSRSTDNGITWSAVAPLNNNAATDLEADAVPTIATDNAGNWVALWETGDTQDGPFGSDLDIVVARSTNNGKTWTDPAPLNNNAYTDFGSDYVPSLATDGAGHWVAVWDSYESLGNTIGTDGDILVARSVDNGVTWSDPAPLNSNAATDIGTSEDNYPIVTTDGGGHWVTVWHSKDSLGGTIGLDEDILVARSVDNGATWTDEAPLNTNAATDVGFDTYPTLSTDGQGKWIAVWMSGDTLNNTIGADFDVLVAASMDNGATWSDPAPLNSNAATDDESDAYPTISNDGDGHWIGAWESKNTLGHTIGHDADILFALSPAPAGSLRLLSPNGGDHWRIGRTRNIQWTSTGDASDNVFLQLLHKDDIAHVITVSTPNDGSFQWTIPGTVKPGKGYTVRLRSTTGIAIVDESDRSFRIKAAK